MEVRVGVQQSVKEVVVQTDRTPEQVHDAVAAAFTDGSLLELTDRSGRTVLVPADKIAYVEVGSVAERRVGFAADA
jgi:hypothetical protein